MPKAVIYETNQEIQKLISDYLKSVGFECIISDDINLINVEEVSLIVAEENQNEIIQVVSILPMYQRRDLMVILLSSSESTMDRISAFVKGVDLIINIKGLKDFPTIFKKAYVEHQKTYKQFKETLSRIS